MLMQLLHWISHLKLSENYFGEHDVGRLPPETSYADSIKRYRNNNQHKNGNNMKPINRLTNMIMQLLQWISHLELSEGYAGEKDVG
jgi:hypothetical protein